MQVHYQWQNGQGDLLVAKREVKPNYGDLLSILREGPGSRFSRSPTNWVDRVRPFFFGMGSSDSVLLAQVGRRHGAPAHAMSCVFRCLCMPLGCAKGC